MMAYMYLSSASGSLSSAVHPAKLCDVTDEVNGATLFSVYLEMYYFRFIDEFFRQSN